MKKHSRKRVSLGNLIAALYEEASNITTDRRLQAVYVWLALKNLRYAAI